MEIYGQSERNTVNIRDYERERQKERDVRRF